MTIVRHSQAARNVSEDRPESVSRRDAAIIHWEALSDRDGTRVAARSSNDQLEPEATMDERVEATSRSEFSLAATYLRQGKSAAVAAAVDFLETSRTASSFNCGRRITELNRNGGTNHGH
jgi:hypothetical protein